MPLVVEATTRGTTPASDLERGLEKFVSFKDVESVAGGEATNKNHAETVATVV